MFKKKAANPQAMQKQQADTMVNATTIKPTENKEPPVDNRPWVDKYYMPGYDVGEVKGYTDLIEKPRCDEEGTAALLKWERYGDIVIITGITDRNEQSVKIPLTINDYNVVGIERRAFIHCNIHTITIPDTITYIGGMAVGFTSKSPFSDDEERKIRAIHPFAENWPTSPFMNKEFFLHINPKTVIIGTENTIAEKYAVLHHLPFSAS